MKLDPDTIKKLAGETAITESTIRRWAKGGNCHSSTKRVLTAALESIQKLNTEPSAES